MCMGDTFFFLLAMRTGGREEGRVVSVGYGMGCGMTEGAFVEMWGLFAVVLWRHKVIAASFAKAAVLVWSFVLEVVLGYDAYEWVSNMLSWDGYHAPSTHGFWGSLPF